MDSTKTTTSVYGFVFGALGLVLLCVVVFFFGLLFTYRPSVKVSEYLNQNVQLSTTGDPLIYTQDAPVLTQLDPVRGSTSARLTIVEFADFQCEYCSQMHELLSTALDEYPNDLQLIWKDLAVLPGSLVLHKAARCAQIQDSFWEYHDALYTNPPGTTQQALIAVAVELGLNEQQFTTCMNTDSMEQWVLDNVRQARELGIDAAPYYFVNGQRVSGVMTPEELLQFIQESYAQ